jgi:hypothetical protein
LPGFIERGAGLSRTWTPLEITHITGLVEPVKDEFITEVRMGLMAKYAQGNNSGGSPLRETTTNLWALENITRFIAHLGDRIDPRVLALRDRAQEILAMPIREGSDGDPSGIPFQRLGDPATYSKGGAFAGGFNESEAANFKLAVLAAADLGKKSAEVLKEVYPAIRRAHGQGLWGGSEDLPVQARCLHDMPSGFIHQAPGTARQACHSKLCEPFRPLGPQTAHRQQS